MDKGVARFKDEKLEVFASLDSSSVNGFCEDPGKRIYLATQHGTRRLNTERGFVLEQILPAGAETETINDAQFYTRTLCFDRNGVLWAGMYRSLLCINQSFSAKSTTGIAHDFVSTLHEDRQGNLWVGTFGGLNQIPAGSDSAVEITNEGDSFDMVHTLLEDREGNIWVGTDDGLVRLRRESIFTFDRRQGLSHNHVVSVLEDQRGRICIGTRGGGVNFLQDGRILPRREILEGDSLTMAMARNIAGGIWLTAENVLELFHLTEEGVFSPGDGYNEKYGRVILQERSGLVWIGTRGGLYCFDGKKFSRYTIQNGLSANSIHDLCEGRDGTFWVATENGLNRKVGERFVSVPASSGNPHAIATCIYEDAEGRLWLGTKKGLALCQNEKFYFRPELPSSFFHESISGILEDNEGNLWMSAKSGILSTPKNELGSVFNGKQTSVQSMTYDASDGLANATFSDTAKPSCWKSRDGRMWFATTKGLEMIDPKSARKPNRFPPPAVIDDIIADKKRASENSPFTASGAQRLTFPPGRGELEIRYTGLSFTAPEKNRFKYKLDGVDSEWVQAGTRRFAYYNNLPPGDYTFHVTACNNDGVWNPLSSSVMLRLLPHFWQTWWFYGLCLAGLSGSAAGIARHLTHRKMKRQMELIEQQHALEKERGRIAQDMHDDLGAGLTQITLLSELAAREVSQPEKVGIHITQISETARDVVQAMDEIVWAVNPRNDNVARLAGYIFHHAEKFFRATSIRFRCRRGGTLPEHPLSAELRHNLFLVVKEALHNVAKHSDATEASLRISVVDSTLEICVEDNGNGLGRKNGHREGNGLNNMRQRMEKAGGEFVVTSEPGKGTRIQMRIELTCQ